MKLLSQARHAGDHSHVSERPSPTQPMLEMVHERRINLFSIETTGTPPKTTAKLAKVSQGGSSDKREYSVTWVSINEEETKKVIDLVESLKDPKPSGEAKAEEKKEAK